MWSNQYSYINICSDEDLTQLVGTTKIRDFLLQQPELKQKGEYTFVNQANAPFMQLELLFAKSFNGWSDQDRNVKKTNLITVVCSKENDQAAEQTKALCRRIGQFLQWQVNEENSIQRIQTIQAKMHQLKMLDRDNMVFGASTHKYMSRRIPETQLRAFEKKYHITIPHELRLFLKIVGSGFGSAHGFLSLPQMEATMAEWRKLCTIQVQPAAPFDFDNKSTHAYLRKQAAHPNQHFYKRTKTMNGTLPICFQGCSYYLCIVVTGEQRGKIWGFDSDLMHRYPARSISRGVAKGLEFFDYYESDLNSALEDLKRQIGGKIEVSR